VLLLLLVILVISDNGRMMRTVAVVADPLCAVADEPPRLYLLLRWLVAVMEIAAMFGRFQR